MASSIQSSGDPSRHPTPNPSHNSRFTSQASTAEDLLKSQTVGLVHLSDFRKRRAEALEQKERESQGGSFGRFVTSSATPASTSGTVTPSDGVSTPQLRKKKRKQVAKGKLSFGVEDDHEERDDDGERNTEPASSALDASRSSTTPDGLPSITASPAILHPSSRAVVEKRRLGPNSTVSIAPKVLTKSALLREVQTREQLRKEFLAMQDAVKATEILVPFVFYDGTNIPGGACKVKKGDYVWLLLDRSRKVGAELGVGGAGERANSRREWARVGVDDLMLVRGEVIIPHHYELYYFIVNKTLGPTNIPLFDYASTLPAPPSLSRSPSSSPSPPPPSLHPIPPRSLTHRPTPHSSTTHPHHYPATSHLEGATDDPNFTKVVDRRWYERNKHIFPASVWEEFDPARDYSKGKRTDSAGNAFFFS